MTEGVRIGAHLELRVPESEGYVTISVSEANCVNCFGFGHDLIELSEFGSLDVIIHSKGEPPVVKSSDDCTVRNGLAEGHGWLARNPAESVFLDVDRNGVHAAANCSDEVPPRS